MQQNPLTIITEILPGKTQALRDYLAPIGLDIKDNSTIHFFDYQQLHYCTFFIIPGNHPAPVNSPGPDLLVFEANIDGSTEQFIRDLFAKNRAFIGRVYSHCAGYPGENTEQQLVEYLLHHDYGANAFYVAHPGQSRQTIYRQRDIRKKIEDYVDTHRPALINKTAKDIYTDIIDHAGKTEAPPQRSFLNRYGDKLIYALIAIFALGLLSALFGFFGLSIRCMAIFAVIAVIIFIVIFLIVLRRNEKRDLQDDLPWVCSEQMRAIQRVEDRQLQNHLTSVIEIKPGSFRLITLRAVLALVNLVAKFVATKGELSGIVTIHFARWVILPGSAGGRRRLLFLSNYDGSWENYLGEFIDHASIGLTAIWSNTQRTLNKGFPNTEFLALRGGSRNEQPFKNFARNSQLAELIWYSAYTDLSVKNIDNNRNIHEGMFESDDIPTWLKYL